MKQSVTERTAFYQILTRKITVLILMVSFFPMILTTGILFYRFNGAYKEKINAHISELVQKHTQNIDSFLSEKLGNIRYLARLFDNNQQTPRIFLQQQMTLLRNQYGDVFTDLGLVDSNGIQFAYEGPFKLENADYSNAKWFIAAKEKAFYISDVFAGLRGHPHFIVTVKVSFNGSNSLLRSTINFGAFNSLVENIQIGRTGIAFIINTKGELQTKMDVRLKDSAIMSILDPDGHKKNETIFSEKQDASGKRYLCVTSMLNNIDWIMVFRQDIGDAFRELRKTQILALVLFLLGCGAIISVAFTLPRNIVKLIASADKKSEVMNRQVIESGKLATIGELAAGIAHEINNPVAIMVEEAGWIEDLLEEEELKNTKNFEEFKRALVQINTQGKRCKEITHKLLSFARKTDSTINDVQINDAVREIVSLTAQMARYNNVIIETELHEGIPFIRISPSELQQVILNLINNAIDAMHKGGGTIKIETKISKLEKNHVVIAVEDNGPGIPKDNLERIFDPFFTTKPVGKGTGLGLSICYGIVQKMGGKIDVYSEVGMGTRFRIWIPFQEPLSEKPLNEINVAEPVSATLADK
ncbi:Integral membrane sensor signal transduction histidine kinase [Desulfamplus magnetovallimortis]|uniref:histidine kinase n=1 Tax=Desulfamplus magnetovallimortis TaxID=1246637 RepID=A0A1W1HJ36_9BACT|nr:PAS domain-containing sensor histidine kinase [Desulfamplus magnetovallimortis]SLM32527.1 Integral membrane sensor signal transduction histidine kinase [Desulfamplus magnetovallimortis]